MRRSFCHPRLRQAFESKLVHRYTKVPMADDPEDSMGESVQTPGVDYTHRPCLYRAQDVATFGAVSTIVVSGPVLVLPHDDDLVVGDKVKNVLDDLNQVIMAGPLLVTEINPEAGHGILVLRRAKLKYSEPV